MGRFTRKIALLLWRLEKELLIKNLTTVYIWCNFLSEVSGRLLHAITIW